MFIVELLQCINLHLCRLAILLHILDNLQRNCAIHACVLHLHDPPECALSECRLDLIAIEQNIAIVIDQMTVLVVTH